jgi:hypothetical protein
MPITGNAIDNNALAALAQRAGPQVTSAIQRASLKTGVDFSYLMEKAAAESSFDTDAQARTSSARGLYQFIESTWLQMVNRYGDKYGLGDYADKISDKGKVADPALRREILALRDDPEIAAMMAGEFAAENRRSLINSGIPAESIGSTELYFAHFLGAGAASEFLKGLNENPLAAAADIFPRAAKANKNVFYNPKTQEARSFGEIHAFFDRKFGNSKVTFAAPALVADNNNQKNSPADAIQVARTSSININQISPDMLAMFSDDMDGMETNLYFGQRISSAASQPALGSTRNLMTDPVALMMLANLETSAGSRTKEDKWGRDEEDDRALRNRKLRESENCLVQGLNP